MTQLYDLASAAEDSEEDRQQGSTTGSERGTSQFSGMRKFGVATFIASGTKTRGTETITKVWNVPCGTTLQVSFTPKGNVKGTLPGTGLSFDAVVPQGNFQLMDDDNNVLLKGHGTVAVGTGGDMTIGFD